MDDTVRALIMLIVVIFVAAISFLVVINLKAAEIINSIDETKRQREKDSAAITAINGRTMELTNKIRICDTRLVTIQQTLNSMFNSKESEKKSTKQEVGKMSYKVKPNRHEITIDFVFEHDGEEYNFKIVERDARQAILDEFVKPESREAVDKFLKENDLWEETLSKLDTFLNEHFEEEFHRAVRKW